LHDFPLGGPSSMEPGFVPCKSSPARSVGEDDAVA
jgi:hypothetical protein